MKNNLRVSDIKRYNNAYSLLTNNPFFEDKEGVIMEYDQYHISFREAPFDDSNALTVYKIKEGVYNLKIYNKEDVYTGVLEFDEEDSTDDEVYFLYI